MVNCSKGKPSRRSLLLSLSSIIAYYYLFLSIIYYLSVIYRLLFFIISPPQLSLPLFLNIMSQNIVGCIVKKETKKVKKLVHLLLATGSGVNQREEVKNFEDISIYIFNQFLFLFFDFFFDFFLFIYLFFVFLTILF